MKPQNLLLLIIMCLLTVACRMGTGENAQLQNKENGINVIRYDKLLNEYVRSNSFSALQKMNMDYRQPTKILIEEVLGLGQVSDDTISQKLKKFYSDTTLLRLMADVEIRYPNLDEVEKGLTKGFENLRKEIPSFHTPVVYSQISAFNESVVLSDTLLGISLDKYMGEDYPLYKRFYYEYQCRSMRPDRIVPDCFVFYLMSYYPFPFQEGSCLLDQMMHSGKINYAVKKLLEYGSTGDAMGYSETEEKWCRENEKYIWEYMLKNRHLYARDPMVVRKYMKPAPFTAFFGENAPALIGTWMGTRIVSAYMKNHKDVSLQQLLETTDYHRMLEESKYLN
ncbi:gliding motility lipoprotein GldB [Oscillospiraceae bacterium N12]|jgi:gliding motility-associated lipoprotein GldB|uniref:Gliding motility lipoprotein GldB n=1 Tax=Jilunia laotingensis TaxID=2763675 RepID=A0A926IIQ8_9BACT|nr:hypothetical protein [Jilunia laotingensis]MBC8592017.1 gliding motility lipoprotein GldB [Jilunia laotingensis]